MFRGTNIATIIWISFMVLICALVCILGYFWIHQEQERFELESHRMEAQYIGAQKQVIKHEVKEVIDFIQFKRSQLQERMRKSVLARVHEARDMAWHLYNQLKGTKPDDEIKTIVKEALRPLRFNNGRGYILYYSTRRDRRTLGR